MSTKDFMSEIYKNVLELNNKVANGLMLSMNISHKKIQVTNKHVKRCSKLLVIREI